MSIGADLGQKCPPRISLAMTILSDATIMKHMKIMCFSARRAR